MKITRLITTVCLIASVLFLCAFADSPTVQLSHDGKYNVDVSYLNAQLDGELLTVTVNYNSGGESFQIGQDITVAADSDFSEPLQMTECNIINGNYVYHFMASDEAAMDTIYIQPPTLYKSVETTRVQVPLSEGQAAQKTAEVESTNEGVDWFSIDTIDIEKDSENLYLVRVNVTSNSRELPRRARIQTKDAELGGLTVLHFDEERNFTNGEFLYYINADSEEEVSTMLEDSSLVVENALIRISEIETRSSSIKSLPVILNEAE